MYIALSLLAGSFVALMVQCNGILQGSLGSLPALTTVHLMGLVVALLYSHIVSNRGRPDFDPADAPVWFLSAGVLGIAVVLLNMIVFARAGILLALGGTLAGQSLGGYIVEMTPWNRSGRSPLIQRLLVLTLIVPGTIIIGIQSGAGASLIFIAFLPGFILVVQSMFNSYNASRWGRPRMLIFNYLSALLLLIPLGFIYGFGPTLGLEELHKVPLYAIIGGGALGVAVVASISYLITHSSPIKTFLGLYAGQLGTGVLIDTILGRAVSPEKLLGVGLVALGLFAGELSRLIGEDVWRRMKKSTQL